MDTSLPHRFFGSKLRFNGVKFRCTQISLTRHCQQHINYPTYNGVASNFCDCFYVFSICWKFLTTGETVITRLVKSAETFPVKDGPNTWTRPEPYRHRQSVLQYEYRVVCAEDQYGPDCATFCRARNDQFGHYGCSADGERECLRGWTKRNEEDIYCMKGKFKWYSTKI